jgi:hypothetical protein
MLVKNNNIRTVKTSCNFNKKKDMNDSNQSDLQPYGIDYKRKLMSQN